MFLRGRLKGEGASTAEDLGKWHQELPELAWDVALTVKLFRIVMEDRLFRTACYLSCTKNTF